MQALYETVKETINSGRIGIPIFARFLVQISSDTQKPEKILARIMSMASSWLGAPPLKIYAQNGQKPVCVNATIQYSGGQTAICIASVLPGANARFDLMLLGNKGGIYHERDILLAESDIETEPVLVTESLKAAIERSLQTGRPVALEEESSE